MKTKQEKVLVIGIDSASPDILERLLKEGKLPVLNKLCNKGLYSRLESTKPPLSPLAWSSFVTGRNPENHGILDFVKRKSNSYEFVPVNSSDRRAASAWEILKRRGNRVGIYNQRDGENIKLRI
jgi:predicted AlkP superfamily phosphohydrolase/phosphomutase